MTSFKSTVEMREPICLIESDESGCMCVRREALEILEQITQPVVVVAIVGLCRTGKSFLMNRLAGKHTGFESNTRGIWMWCVSHPCKAEHTLVLLDTEGLDKGDEKHDTWLFCLAVLLSSTLVYNSIGAIDDDALEKLHCMEYVTELLWHIKVKSGSGDEDQFKEFKSFFPSFVWTLQDFPFTLELEERPITANQYLEDALQLKTEGSSSQILQYNQTRCCLREFFSVRKCFVFECPASIERIKQLRSLTDADLEPTFLEQVQDFCGYILTNSHAKTMRGGLELTGRIWGNLTEMYVEAIHCGEVPCLDETMESLVVIQNSCAATEAVEYYQREMWSRVTTETQKEWSVIHEVVKREAMKLLINNSLGDLDQHCQQEFKRSLQSLYEEYYWQRMEEPHQMNTSVFSPEKTNSEKDDTFMMVSIRTTVEMPEPICLIDNDTNGHMCVRREALEILEKITQPVVVVAIVGLYRTGKSFLMNKLASKHTGFALGATIESKTKGIWMWCLPHPTKEGHTLVLLDTEGLGDIDKGDEKHDTWIFCLAVLLSSTLVYNSMGTINNDALEKLHYVTELTEHIKVKSGPANYDQSSEFMAIFPSFVWAVRDFTLTLELEGRPITADQYLESALKLKTGSSRKMEEYNQPRRCLREFFSERKCFVFERPTSVEKMKKMEQLADTDLEPNFVKQTQDFCNYIFMNARAKTIREGLGLTGRMLGSLAETYVKAIRSGQVPCLDNAVESLSEIQNRRAINEALDFYKKTMSCKVKLPTETQGQLSDIHAAVEKEAVAIFINGSFNDHDQRHQLEFMKTVQSVYDEYCMKNIEESCQMCRSVISCVFGWLEIAVREGSFMHPGGYKEYCSAMKEATEQYRSEKGHRLMSEEVLKEYLNERDGIGKSILAADRSLTECQRQNELQQLKSEALEQRKRALEEQNSIQQQQMKAQERTYEENIKQLLVKMEQEQQRNQEEHKRVLNAKLKEQSDLLEQGFKGRAESLQKEINDLREDRRRQEESQPSTVSKVLDTVGTAAAIFLPGIGKVAGLGLSLISKWFK